MRTLPGCTEILTPDPTRYGRLSKQSQDLLYFKRFSLPLQAGAAAERHRTSRKKMRTKGSVHIRSFWMSVVSQLLDLAYLWWPLFTHFAIPLCNIYHWYLGIIRWCSCSMYRNIIAYFSSVVFKRRNKSLPDIYHCEWFQLRQSMFYFFWFCD